MRRSKHRTKHGRTPHFLGRIFTRRRPERPATTVAAKLTFEVLEPRLQMAVVISEFMASNSKGLTDQDGAHSDWVELSNTAASPVNLGGYYLTDDLSDLDKWQIPSTNLPANGHIVIFASGKDRATSGQELHTNFSLSKDGESLALVMPDGTTIADSFANFPAQFDDVSYGIGQITSNVSLVEAGAAAQSIVPTSGNHTTYDPVWNLPAYTPDANWVSGTTGVGFGRTFNGFLVTEYQANTSAGSPIGTTLDSIDEVLALVNNPAAYTSVTAGDYATINFFNTGSPNRYTTSQVAFPGQTNPTNYDHFATEAHAKITIPSAGDWTFAFDHNEGYLLRIGSQEFKQNGTGSPEAFQTFTFDAAGTYDLDLYHFERTGSAWLKLYAAPGVFTSFNAGAFDLVGDTANGGLAVVSDFVGGSGTKITPLLGTNLQSQMLNVNSSFYTRIPFNVADPAALDQLKLRMKYDDAFVAYLNGQEVARRNFAGTPAWNSVAGSSRGDEAVTLEEIDISAFLSALVAGPNVLAIQGLNFTAGNPDALVLPELIGIDVLSSSTLFFTAPTPGTANQSGVLGFVADTKFSVDRGFFDSPFNVQITTATPGATIRYTVDGSQPTETTGLVYNPASPPLIATTTNLRAAAFLTGYAPTNVDTQTYIFLDDVIHQNGSGLPPYTNWGWVGADWAMDPDVVNNPQYAGTIKDDLKSVPTVSLVMPWDDWFGPAGVGIYPTANELEKFVSMEFFSADGSENFQIDAGIEIQGGTSDDRWKMDKLSMRVKFKQPYGPTKFDADIFNNPIFDGGAAISFDTLILDAQSNYTWAYGGGSAPIDQRARAKLIQDQYISDLQNLAGGLAPHGLAAHLYINGIYWGVYIIHERPDDSFDESYLGGDKDDYDVLKHNANTIVSGDTTALPNYAAMLNLARQNMSVPANYAAVEQKVDIDGLIDYMIINYYAGNDDWAHHNWYASFNRVDPNGKWRFHSWDAEHVLKDVNYNAIQTGSFTGSPEEIHLLLSANSEYRLRFADHVQERMYNGGLLTPTGAAAVYMARMAEVDRAIVGESARWGDSHTTTSEPPGAGNAYTRDHWLATQNDLLNNYFPARTNVVLGQFAARGWTVPLVAPLFSQYGGAVTPVSQLTLSKPGGSPVNAQIYYTLDGSDPRNPTTNLPSASAILYNGSPLTFADGLGKHVQARIYLDDALSSSVDEWSPIVDKTFLQATSFPVRITEFNYHPALSEDHEFFELTNTSSQPVNLAGVQITQFQSDPVVLGNVDLAAGERIILAKNPSAFQAQYGTGYNVLPTGYSGNLSNSGEQIVLLGPLGETLQSFTYSDSAPWPTTPDGSGPTLEIINPLGDPSNPANWRASLYVGGSPGASGVPGDYDGNGIVEQADHGMWRAAYGTTVAVGISGDGNRNGIVDLADYVMWRKAMTPPASSATIAAGVGSGDETIIVSSASIVAVQVESQTASRPVLPAVDDAFSRFDSARPAYRPMQSRAPSTDAGGDGLLLASLAYRAALGEAEDADIAVDGASDDGGPIDQLFAEWAGVADAIN